MSVAAATEAEHERLQELGEGDVFHPRALTSAVDPVSRQVVFALNLGLPDEFAFRLSVEEALAVFETVMNQLMERH